MVHSGDTVSETKLTFHAFDCLLPFLFVYLFRGMSPKYVLQVASDRTKSSFSKIPETTGLKDTTQVENLQDQALAMLRNHIESRDGCYIQLLILARNGTPQI